MDAKLIQIAAKSCGWEHCHTGPQTWHDLETYGPDVVLAFADEITPAGCESMKDCLREDYDISIFISDEEVKVQLFAHGSLAYQCYRSAKGPTEADALLAAIAQLEDGK